MSSEDPQRQRQTETPRDRDRQKDTPTPEGAERDRETFVSRDSHRSGSETRARVTYTHTHTHRSRTHAETCLGSPQTERQADRWGWWEQEWQGPWVGATAECPPYPVCLGVSVCTSAGAAVSVAGLGP